ncbi:hypothetical protein [Pseudomonas sp. 910_21]|uniref:hypothetical protein n=1 Tax=Pseudomonas sp. 910_21 TaxID=2604460 RepID=UPI004062D167
MTLRTTLLALLSWTALAQAEGELLVMPASLKVYNNHEHSVTVRNVGDAPLYLSINLLKVMNPGLEPEHKVPLQQLDRPGILASPDKLTLGPGQSRAISLKSLAEPGAEELFRLYIVPVRSMQVEEAPQDKISAPMSVAVGYGVLVRHMPPPAKQQSGWSHRCDATGLTLENTGNVRLVLSEVEVDRGSHKRKVALFPGTPQHFNGKRLSLLANDQPQTLECP